MTYCIVGNIPDYNSYRRKNRKNYGSASELYLRLFVTLKKHIADTRGVQATATGQGQGIKRRHVNVPQRACNNTRSVLIQRKLNGKAALS